MALRHSIHDFRFKIYNKVTNIKVVEICTLLVLVVYIPLVFIGVVIAYIFGGEGLSPGMYAIWDNWISDLGSRVFTPAPWLYDTACVVAGIFTIPFVIYMEKILAPFPKTEEELRITSRLRLRIGFIALVWGLIGSISYIGVGIWSGDRAIMKVSGVDLPMHGICSVLAFSGFTFGAFFMGWLIILYKDIGLPKSLGIYGIFGPLITLVLNGIFGGPFLEWMLLFSILAWVIPLSLITLNKEKSKRK